MKVHHKDPMTARERQHCTDEYLRKASESGMYDGQKVYVETTYMGQWQGIYWLANELKGRQLHCTRYVYVGTVKCQNKSN